MIQKSNVFLYITFLYIIENRNNIVPQYDIILTTGTTQNVESSGITTNFKPIYLKPKPTTSTTTSTTTLAPTTTTTTTESSLAASLIFFAYMEDGVNGTMEAEIGSNGTDANLLKEQTTKPPSATYSYYFNGSNSYAQYGVIMPSTYNSASASIWIYPTEIKDCGILDVYFQDGDAAFMLRMTSNGALIGGVRKGASSVSCQTANSTVSINNWYHILITERSGDTVLYVNNVLKSDSNQFDLRPMTWEPSDAYIGLDGVFFNRFKGYLGHFKVYNMELEEWQRNIDYNNGQVWYL